MLQNQYFEIMEDIIRNDESDKPTAAPKSTARKPSATGVTPPKAAKPAAKPAAQSPVSNTSAGPARPTAKKRADTITPSAEKASGVSAPVA